MLKSVLVKNVEVLACYCLMRFLRGSEFAVIQTKNRSVCENAVTGIWGSCAPLVMSSWAYRKQNLTPIWPMTSKENDVTNKKDTFFVVFKRIFITRFCLALLSSGSC